MTDTVAACRAALREACAEYRCAATRLDGADFPVDARLVNVDDAAACMARAIRAAAEQPDMYLAVDAALAAAQEQP